MRFNHKAFSHAQAVANTLVLLEAAKRAGVGRVVHVSITKPSEASPLEYFRGKEFKEFRGQRNSRNSGDRLLNS